MGYDCRQMFAVVSRDVELPENSRSQNCVTEGFLRCTYEFIADNKEKMTVEYTLITCDDKDLPFGICGMLLDSRLRVIDRRYVHKKFSTLTECLLRMHMLAKDTVLPNILEYVL